MIHFVSRKQIDAIIKECQKLDELMVLVVMQEDGSGFTVVCDHIVSHCDDLIYTHITKGYASFVFSNNRLRWLQTNTKVKVRNTIV